MDAVSDDELHAVTDTIDTKRASDRTRGRSNIFTRWQVTPSRSEPCREVAFPIGSTLGPVRRTTGGVAEWLRQGPAKPSTWVRFPAPPLVVSRAGVDCVPNGTPGDVDDLGATRRTGHHLHGRGAHIEQSSEVSAQLVVCFSFDRGRRNLQSQFGSFRLTDTVAARTGRDPNGQAHAGGSLATPLRQRERVQTSGPPSSARGRTPRSSRKGWLSATRPVSTRGSLATSSRAA